VNVNNIHEFVVDHLQESLDHLHKFVRGAAVSERGGNEGELVRSALQLLQSLPATRPAVLQYVSDVYDEAVNQHFEQRKHVFRAYIPQLLLKISATS